MSELCNLFHIFVFLGDDLIFIFLGDDLIFIFYIIDFLGDERFFFSYFISYWARLACFIFDGLRVRFIFHNEIFGLSYERETLIETHSFIP